MCVCVCVCIATSGHGHLLQDEDRLGEGGGQHERDTHTYLGRPACCTGVFASAAAANWALIRHCNFCFINVRKDEGVKGEERRTFNKTPL